METHKDEEQKEYTIKMKGVKGPNAEPIID